MGDDAKTTTATAGGNRGRKKRGRKLQAWEYAGDGRKGSTKSSKLLPHWRDSHLWCPHCERTFKYAQMWGALGRKGLTVWEAADLLKVSHPTIIAAMKTHGMQLALKGTQERNALEELAVLNGFHSGREMLYQWLMRERQTYGRVARFLDMPVDDVRTACEELFLGTAQQRIPTTTTSSTTSSPTTSPRSPVKEAEKVKK